MAEGRSCKIQLIIPMMFALLLLNVKFVESKDIMVGWSNFHSKSSRKNKDFIVKAGDNVVFVYDNKTHKVAWVNKEDYDSCTSVAPIRMYSSGKDGIGVKRGTYLFICPIHCLPKQGNMKVNITAL